MNVYLVQHAEAKREEEDPARPLTEKGWDDARRVARYAFERAGVRPARIYHSGKRRAQQTAEAWKEQLGTVEVAQTDGLDPMADPKIWMDRLGSETMDLMLVGHLPHLRCLAAGLLCGDTGREMVMFQMAGVVYLEKGEGGAWSIRWILTPDIIGP